MKKKKESLPFYVVCKNIQTFTLQKNLLMSQHNSRNLLEICNVSAYFQITREIKKFNLQNLPEICNVSAYFQVTREIKKFNLTKSENFSKISFNVNTFLIVTSFI
jgi:hypothetical protein